jgi:hypothetical protein
MTKGVVGSILPFLLLTAPAWSQEEEILKAHNRYRAEVGVSPLSWSGDLARDAQRWAKHLGSRRRGLTHSSNGHGEGENLWMGPSRHYSFTHMVESWGNEKQYFVNGNFPNVSKTDGWQKVGHYTQVVWRNTKQVGCAGVDAGGHYYFVCRYRPAGNYMGQRAFRYMTSS